MICVDVKHIVDGLSLFQWVIVLTICAMGLFGNIVYTTAMKYVSPTKGNVFRSFEVITNYVLQIYLQGCTYHPSAIFGISFLSMSVVLIGSESILRTKLANRFPYLHRIW